MIVDKIIHNALVTPDKEAIIYQGETISYAALTNGIHRAEELYKGGDANFFLVQESPVETIFHVLALSALNKGSIVLPKDFEANQKAELLEQLPKSKAKNAFLGILSSGSTGNQKVIWKTNANWEQAFEHQSEVFGINKKDNVFVLDAMAYSANLNAALHILWEGGTLVLGTLKQAMNWETQFVDNRVSSFFLVPSHCRLLTKTTTSNYALRSMVTAGEKLDVDTAKTLLDIYPDAQLTEYYGAAELGHISYHQNEAIVNQPHSVGQAFPEVKISIKEDKVTVKSPYVSSDYKVTATVNDLGYFDGDSLILQGRAGRMFNRRGLNIYAQEIENLALQSSFASVAALVENHKTTKLTLYFTSENTSADLNEGLLSKFLKEKLPIAKHPNFIKELREIPHSEAGKIDFKALSKMGNEEEVMARA